VTAAQKSLWFDVVRRFFTPATERVSEWVQEHIVFNEPGCSGRFNFDGREYLREPIDTWGLEDVTDVELVFGTRCGKTRTIYAGLGYIVEHTPTRILCVKPTTHGTAGALGDARTRFIPMIRSSPTLSAYIPTKSRRHDFKTPQQMIHGSIIDWTGSNSVANLASNPARVVIQDEVDKFNTTRKRDDEGNRVEADASALADERCKEFSNPKRFKASTPTLASGLIWQELMKSDLRRYFVPCPHCQKFVVFIWNKKYTALPLLPECTHIWWDPEAKNAQGVWDLERVAATAHMVCPHCQGKILESHKPEMVKRGEWRPTQTGVPGYRGFHLPSMYCSHKETSFGRLAVKFLKQKQALQGRQSFIQNDLAEPYQMQDIAQASVEVVRRVQVEITGQWEKILTGDYQQRWPYIWYVLRAWLGGDSEGILAGHCDTFDQLRDIQVANGVKDYRVYVDSGYKAPEVYKVCAGYGEILPRSSFPWIHTGWIPTKGFPKRTLWRDPKTGIPYPFRFQKNDPFAGTTEAGKVESVIFEFASMYFEDRLWELRDGKNRSHGFTWAISDQMDKAKFEDGSTYQRHLAGHMLKQRQNSFSGRTSDEWVRRHSSWPDHILDDEITSVAVAIASNIFRVDQLKQKPKEELKAA
jgi:hypothetical protein